MQLTSAPLLPAVYEMSHSSHGDATTHHIKVYIQTLVENGPVVSVKKQVKFSYLNDIGPR